MTRCSCQGTDLDVDPLLMNAFNNVNLAASCVLTSTEYARRLGISESKWIYPLGGGGTQDSDNCGCPFLCVISKYMTHERGHTAWERANFYSSPAISRSLDVCLEISDLAKEEIDLFDFYSYVKPVPALVDNSLTDTQNRCFPVVPKLACQHIGLPLTKPITLLGGLTSFGGAGNNYSMHVSSSLNISVIKR